MTEVDNFFVDAVTRLCKLTNSFSEFPLGSTTTWSLNRTSMVRQRAMTFMEEDLRTLLEDLEDSAVTMTKRSVEKLFKYLDMFEAMRDLIPSINKSCSNECENEIQATANRLGEAAMSIFCYLENSIKNDVVRTPVPGGAVHPLTSYVMNYLKYTCEYKVTLEHIFQQHVKLEKSNSPVKLKPSLEVETENECTHCSERVAGTTPFSIQLMMIMDLLDTNLEAK
ncbi:hypothetical protein RND71_002267 [Anisodus tanguticus]|uniref:Exocyst subunit Exo70 family protein n=1 Tax=Anisodus tanguticus TaxID=243964 RepID=A0AAE1T2P3_9SOLA|nr:hypothetical protein RND71_002267 [Anisodus tanguticus]